jgi:general secretion pathway protein G
MNEQIDPNEFTRPVGRPKTRCILPVVMLSLAAILAFAALTPFCSVGRARLTAAIMQISNLGTALEAFKVDNGYFPPGTNGLSYLMQAPAGATNWQGPYMTRAVVADPWGHPYIYECPGRHNPQTFDLSALSPDGEEICNWKKNEIPSRWKTQG